jgi:hypothetical protein
VLADIGDVFNNDAIAIAEDELVDLRYTCQKATQDAKSWKGHQLRSITQDESRLDVLRRLDQSSVLITNDWAMKFLPQKYRESQSDWFAKRGISWHISVVARKVENVMETQTFVHIVENCSQDASVVVRITEHVLRTLHEDSAMITNAYPRQDNAGCYHSGSTLTAYLHMGCKTGVNVSRVDFSEPQGGKGPCDGKAATIKAHVRRFINEGNDVTTARQFRDAIMSSGGVPGVRVAMVDAAGLCDPHVEWDGISRQNNFEYTDGKITAWEAYGVGIGRVMQQRDTWG